MGDVQPSQIATGTKGGLGPRPKPTDAFQKFLHQKPVDFTPKAVDFTTKTENFITQHRGLNTKNPWTNSAKVQ